MTGLDDRDTSVAGGAPPPPARLRTSTIVMLAALLAAVLAASWMVGPDTPWAAARRATTPALALAAVAGNAANYGGPSDGCGDDAIACVYDGSTTVFVATEFAELDEGELQDEWGTTWTDVMRHEYMHVLQHRVIDLDDDADFQRLFGEVPAEAAGDDRWDDVRWEHELSAECMAEVLYDDYRRSYPGDCTVPQRDYAGGLARRALDTSW